MGGRIRRNHVILAAAVVLLALAALSPLVLARSGSSRPLYLDAHQSVAARVNDLLGRMSLADKVGQMTLISVSRLRGNCQGTPGPLNPICLRRVLSDARVGAILSGGGEAPLPNTPRSWAEMTNAIQRYALHHAHLSIPVLYGADAVHGHNNVLGVTIFPHNIGMAATWDPGLVEQEEAATAATVRATGVHWTFAPVSDIARDFRWGRYYETFGEDPYLASTFVTAAVAGFQGKHGVSGVAATAKHFVGYSQPLTGHDRTPAWIPLRALRESFLPPFRGAVNAGVDTVMANSGSVNGVPVHASHYLLTTVLRGQLRFQGVVVTDWGDIEALHTRYHVAADSSDAIRQAILAGVDMSMVPYDAAGFTSDLAALVRAGRVPMARIDEAVRRILTLKMKLGLFTRPYVDARAADRVALGTDRPLARRAADESMVLLKNAGSVLPLGPTTRSILVVGSVARSVADQMGGWTLGWQGIAGLGTPPATTILQGIERAAPRGVAVRYVSGADPRQAATGARKAGVVVIAVGEQPYAEGQGDTETATLPSAQQKLFAAVRSSGTPVVTVIVAGRPLILSGVAGGSRALLMAWLPGTAGGEAVADVLFGRYDPSGRLAVTWPRSVGAGPLVYTELPGTNAGPNSGYHPQFPFGYGLSYTTYADGHLRVRVAGKGRLTVTLDVRDSGTRDGTDIIQVYVHADNSPVLVPARTLAAFARVSLRAGETRAVTLTIPLSRLAVIPGDILGTAPPVVEPGSYTFTVGTLSTTATIP